MKKRGLTLALAGILSGLMSITSPAQNKPMQPVLNQLDLDGNFLLFMDTSDVRARVHAYIDLFSDFAKASADEANVDEVVTMVKSALDDSGLISVDSYATSTKLLDDGLTRTINVLEYGADDANKILWRILASEPRALSGVEYAPADTVLLANITASLNELWNVFNETTAKYLPPEQQETLKQQLAMVEMLLGAPLSDLFTSVDDEMFIAFQLSEELNSTIPVDEVMLSIPEPGALLGLRTKNPMLSEQILQKLSLAGAPVTAVEKDGVTLHTVYLPMPMPISLAPTLVQTDDYLLIGTNPETVAKALDCKRRKNGLIATPLYKKLLKDAPAETSAITFVSPRLMKTAMDTLVTAIGETEEEAVLLLNRLIGGMDSLQAGEYVLKTPTGFYSKSYGNISASPGEMIMTSGTAYVGMLASIGVPGFHKARTTAGEKACENNCRLLECAKEQWAIENDKSADDQPTEEELSPYLDGVNVQCPLGGIYEINPVGIPASCSLHGTAED